jgi:c-di-GMP-related signal transduction protein
VSTGALEDGSSAPMPDVFVSKYNKFVDGIFTRINTILKKSYDPVNVQLNMEAEVKSATGNKKSNKK